MAQREVTRVGAYGLIVEDERLLLCRISSELPKFAGQWTLPGGGIDFGEDPVDAMVREVKEETGLEVCSAGLAAVDSITGSVRDMNFHSLRIIYYTDVLGGTLTNEEEGTTDQCAWFSRREVSEITLVDLVQNSLPLVWPV